MLTSTVFGMQSANFGRPTAQQKLTKCAGVNGNAVSTSIACCPIAVSHLRIIIEGESTSRSLGRKLSPQMDPTSSGVEHLALRGVSWPLTNVLSQCPLAIASSRCFAVVHGPAKTANHGGANWKATSCQMPIPASSPCYHQG